MVTWLDHATQLGIVQSVSGGGGFNQGRDMGALVKEVGEWNEMLAAFAGRFCDSSRPRT